MGEFGMSDTAIVLLFIPGLFLLMLLLLGVGRRIGMRRMAEETERERVFLITVEGAIYGLLGLLVAFTFAGAASRFEARRLLTVQEANAIGTAYLRLDLLPVAAQPALREKFRLYTEARLAVFRVLPDLAASNAQATRATALQQEIWNGAAAALREAAPTATLLLLPALNEMIDATSGTSVMATIGQRIVVAPCCSSMRANTSSSRVSGTTIRRPAKASPICPLLKGIDRTNSLPRPHHRA
jgi:hypothetical protein